MRCQQVAVVSVEGTPFGREGIQVPLCERHSKEDVTSAKPTAIVETTGETVSTSLAPKEVQTEAEDEISVAKETHVEIDGFTIATDEDLAFAGECLGEVKGHWNRLEERKKQVTGPLNAALQVIRGWFQPAQSHYAASEVTLKAKIAGYHAMRAKERQAALDAAAAAVQVGNSEATRVAIAAVPPPPPKLVGISVQDAWEYEVFDFTLVPDRFKVVNHALVMAEVKLNKGATQIPGIRPVQGSRVVARAT
jgi:hypothetical protein